MRWYPLLLTLFLFLTLLTLTKGELYSFQMPEEVPTNTVIADLPSLFNIPSMKDSPNVNYRFKILTPNPIYHQMFAIDQRTGTLRTNGPIDRDQLCQRAELCCTMMIVGQHDTTSTHDVKVVGMEALQSKLGNHIISTGLKCSLDFRIAFSSKPTGFPTSFASIHIDLLDLNDNAPKFTGLTSAQISRNYDGSLMYIASIPEGAHIGFQLPLPLAQDGDAGSFGVQGYKLEEPSSQMRLEMDPRLIYTFPFELILPRRDDGVILPKLELREPLDYEKRQDYYITLVAFDVDQHLPHSAEILVRVDVLDENDNQPNVSVRTRLQGSFDALTAGSGRAQIHIREDTPVGTLLANFEARDADSGENGRVTFAWAEIIPPRVQRLFDLNPTSGELRLADRLDYDTLSKSSSNQGFEAYNLVVVASDDGKPNRLSTSASIVIELVDVNDEEPKITLMDLANRSPTQLEVLENEERDTFVALVTVQDLDGANGPNGQFYCTINSTFFRLIAADTFAGHKVPPLPGILSTEHEELAFTEGHSSVFGAGRAEFQLVTTTSFDREQTAVHFVAIRCQDRGSPSLESQATFTVTVLDVNDNPPQFPINPLTVTIAEDAQVGNLVVSLNATDPDRPDDVHPVTYSLVTIIALSTTQPMSAANSSHFRLEGHTGRLLLAEPLDRETNAEYQLTVRATDRGSPKTQSCDLVLRIQILDVNDNAPVFGSPSGYRFVIEEEKEAGSVVGVVSATDADEGKNGKISYRLFGTAAAVQRGFAINPTTGEITTKVSLDREVNAVYEFFVTAEDSAPSKRLTATAKVTVELLDINDNDPKFIYPTQPNHTIHASAYSKVGTAIVKLTVFDADAAGEQGLLFLMKNSTSHGLFSLSPSSGELAFAREVLDDDIGSHFLEIEAKDNGVPSRSSITSITVVIDAKNPQRNPGSINTGAEYVNSPTYSKSWNHRDEAAYSLYGQDTSVEVYSRQDSPPAFDRRLILISCLAFLGCLLLVVFGAILIRFRHRAPTENAPPTNPANFVHAKEAKYKAATLQPQTSVPGKDLLNRYVYGWSAQRSPLVGGSRCANATVPQQQQRMLQEHHHQQQQEQFLRLGFMNGTTAGAVAAAAESFDNAIQARPCRGEVTLQAKNRSSSLGDSLEEYERPPIPIVDRANIYLSQGQMNRVDDVWEQRADKVLNNYEAPGDGNGYYNKVSASGGGGGGGTGVILQPGMYTQGGQFFRKDCVEDDGVPDPECAVFLTNTRSATAARNAGYQTLFNTTASSPGCRQQPPLPTVTVASESMEAEAEAFEASAIPPSAFELVGSSAAATAWRKDLAKKGIVSSSFV
uniref:Protocadherin 1 n=1 Tax=Echinococcus granulosus TaxID=6210 RepID=A0A068X3J3_ECHGR|nr:protocadherin 1 [Echinococcus granulosus]